MVLRHPVQPRDRRRHAVRLQVRARPRLRRRRPGRRRRPAQAASTCRRCWHALNTRAPRPTWSTARRFRGDPGYKVPFGRRARQPDLLGRPDARSPARRITDPTSGFRMVNRRGIELFARDYPHDYPEVEAILMLHDHRLRIHEVQVRMNARGFGRSSIDYPRSRLLHGQGHAGAVRRPAPPPPGRLRGLAATGDRRVRRRRAAAGAERRERWDVVSADGPPDPRREQPRRQAPAHRRDRHPALPRARDRAGAAPAPRRALRAALDLGLDRARRARRLERRAQLARRHPRHPQPAERALLRRRRRPLLPRPPLLRRDLAAQRGDEGPRPGGRSARPRAAPDPQGSAERRGGRRDRRGRELGDERRDRRL